MFFLPYTLVFPFVLSAVAKPPVDLNFPDPPSSSDRNVVQDNFMGISWELSSFDTLWGKTPDTMPVPMINYLGNIRARMSNPLRIRVGGNGMDASTYVSDKTDMLTITNSGYNEITVDFGPVFFDVLNAMADSIGKLQVIIGLSMRDPQNDDNVIQLATAAKEKLGDSLDALLLGNEPDLYQGHENREFYNLDLYIPEVRGMMDGFREVGLLDKQLIGGPTTCCTWTLDEVIEAGLDQFDYKYYSIQHYPTHGCTGENEINTNITAFLTHTTIDPYINWNEEGVNRAAAQGTDVILSEYNSVACGGTSISDTFAMTLWSLDVEFKAAASKYSATYIHTREYDIKYNLFDPPQSALADPSQGNVTDWRTGAPYYSTIFLAEAMSAEGSVVVDLNTNDSSTNPEASIAAYGIYDQGGDTKGKLALINYNHDHSVIREDASSIQQSSEDSAQVFRIPAGLTSSVQYRILEAPSTWENSRISWAGQTVGGDGLFHENVEGTGQVTGSMECGAGCDITVPGPGAALVFLENAVVYFRDSTTVPIPESEITEPENRGLISTATAVGVTGIALVGMVLMGL